MNELSLFTGAGGGLLGTLLLGWKHIGYVEYDDYCQKVIAQRIKDGILDEAPIFGDIRAFISEGYAASYQGMVDIITGGFPCQPFSVAGKQAGEDDERNMWPATIECIRIIRPQYALLENVPGLLSSGYFQQVLGDLAEAGYNAKWCVLGAGEIGASHLRRRVWILAYSTSIYGISSKKKWRIQLQKSRGFESRSKIKSLLNRKYDGMASDVDRLKALGNGQVPAVVRAVWELLNDYLH